MRGEVQFQGFRERGMSGPKAWRQKGGKFSISIEITKEKLPRSLPEGLN